MLDALGPDRLAVVANTGDDIAAFGLHVSPDPDLVTYWLAGTIDEQRGWGVRDESFHVFERLVELGGAEWFRLGDRDLATCLLRTEMLHEGMRLTEITQAIARAHGVGADVLPMSDEPVQTYVHTEGEWRHFQEYLILQRSGPALAGVEFRGAEQARLTPEVQEALAQAEAIVIGPSNPIASIGPMLAVPGMRDALVTADAPVVAVSPLVGGRAVKGPADRMLARMAGGTTPEHVAGCYQGLIDALVVDESDPVTPLSVRAVVTRTLMTDLAASRRLAEAVLEAAA
jgi:LPPG:FO 2-phospho-L-lactate transferase